MIVSLQYLRGIAAMMVVAFHATEKLGRMAGYDHPASFTVGLAGVDIFFVISGFIMLATTWEKDITPAAFVRKRIERIVPLYWLLTLLVAAVILVRPGLLATATLDSAHFAASLLFIPWPHPSIEAHMPLLVPGWTLNYEMAFYALFAASLLLPSRLRVVAMLTTLGGAAAAGLLAKPDTIAAFYLNAIILEFGAGLLLARLWLAGVTVNRWLALGVAMAGFVALQIGSTTQLPRVIWAGVPSLAIVAGIVFAEGRRRTKPLALPTLLGDASYSIYLSHVIVLPVFARGWNAAGLGVGVAEAPIFLALALFVSACAGVALFLAVERPMMRGFARRRSTARIRSGWFLPRSAPSRRLLLPAESDS